jgi:hypothetical protein
MDFGEYDNGGDNDEQPEIFLSITMTMVLRMPMFLFLVPVPVLVLFFQGFVYTVPAPTTRDCFAVTYFELFFGAYLHESGKGFSLKRQ